MIPTTYELEYFVSFRGSRGANGRRCNPTRTDHRPVATGSMQFSI